MTCDYRRQTVDRTVEAPNLGRKTDQIALGKASQTHADLKEASIAVQKTQQRYRPGYQYHGFVWLFLRIGSS